MGVFIELKIDGSKCLGIARCGKCVEFCPVNVFDKDGEEPRINSENEDECVLCDLCVNACVPRALQILKLY